MAGKQSIFPIWFHFFFLSVCFFFVSFYKIFQFELLQFQYCSSICGFAWLLGNRHSDGQRWSNNWSSNLCKFDLITNWSLSIDWEKTYFSHFRFICRIINERITRLIIMCCNKSATFILIRCTLHKNSIEYMFNFYIWKFPKWNEIQINNFTILCEHKRFVQV